MPLFNNHDRSNAAMDSPSLGAQTDLEKHTHTNKIDDGDYPILTFRTFLMAILVAMGGFIFGYDTGQISGFLEMPVFLELFGELGPVSDAHPTGYYFTNVRSGLIVALLSIGTLIGCLIAGPVANKLGRKPSVPVWCLVFVVGGM